MGSERQLFDGRFSDGESARSVAVSGTIDGEALVFWEAGAVAAPGELPPVHHRWLLADVTTVDPVRAGDPDVLVQNAGLPGASLFVADRAFVRRLAQVARHTSPRARSWAFIRPALGILIFLAGVAGGVYAFDVSPARSLAHQIPPPVRDRLADTVLTSLAQGRRTCSTAAGSAALAKMVARIDDAVATPFDVKVIDWRMQNAFALPGGHIVLTRGLVEKAAGPAEVAGVLAHELGHVVELHPETALVRAVGLMVAAQFVFTGGAETLGNLGTALVALSFSRDAEVEADTIGLALLRSAQVNPKPLAGFFRRLVEREERIFAPKRRKGESKDAYDKRRRAETGIQRSLQVISTHPSTRDRIAKIEAVPSYETRPVLTDEEWAALRAICKEASGQEAPGQEASGKEAPSKGENKPSTDDGD